MKHIILSAVVFLTIIYGCRQEQTSIQKNNKINVGVLDRSGDCPFCINDVVEALRIDSNISPRKVSAADIIAGKTMDIAVYILPGGGGLSELTYLGDKGKEILTHDIVENGKAIIGICAGAYTLTETPDYPSLALSGAEAIDIEHDHRGHGVVKFSLTGKGEQIFPELKNRKINFMQY